MSSTYVHTLMHRLYIVYAQRAILSWWAACMLHYSPRLWCITGHESSLPGKDKKWSIFMHTTGLLAYLPACADAIFKQPVIIFYFLHLHTNQAQTFPVTDCVLWAISFKQQVPTSTHTHTKSVTKSVVVITTLFLWCRQTSITIDSALKRYVTHCSS